MSNPSSASSSLHHDAESYAGFVYSFERAFIGDVIEFMTYLELFHDACQYLVDLIVGNRGTSSIQHRELIGAMRYICVYLKRCLIVRVCPLLVIVVIIISAAAFSKRVERVEGVQWIDRTQRTEWIEWVQQT